MKLEIRPIVPNPLKPKLVPNIARTKSSSETATKPNIAATTQVRNRLLTWMSKNLYAASVPATAPSVPRTAPTTRPSPKLASITLLKAPMNSPSNAA